jgi:hypothetical protein
MKIISTFRQFESIDYDDLNESEIQLVKALEFPLLTFKDLDYDYNLGGRETFRKLSGNADYEVGFSQWHKDTGVSTDFKDYVYFHVLPDKNRILLACFFKYREPDEIVSSIKECLSVAKKLEWNYTIRINKLRERGYYHNPSQINVQPDELLQLLKDWTFRIGIHFWK